MWTAVVDSRTLRTNFLAGESRNILDYLETMAPKYLTGNQAAIGEFIDKFDVRKKESLMLAQTNLLPRSSSSTAMV